MGGGICFVRGGVWAGSNHEVVGSVWYNFYQENYIIQNNISARRGSSG